MQQLWLIPVLPLAGFLINGIFGRRFSKTLVNAIAIGTVLLSFAWALKTVVALGDKPYSEHYFDWIVAGGLRLPGCGPFRFGFEIRPLPLATSNCLPSGVTRTDVGYQPTGINPSGRLFPEFETSKTARLLLQALAIKSSAPSGDKARLFGVEPGGDAG